VRVSKQVLCSSIPCHLLGKIEAYVIAVFDESSVELFGEESGSCQGD